VNDPAACHSGAWCARGDLIAGDQPGTAFSWRAGGRAGDFAQNCTTFPSSAHPHTPSNEHLFFRLLMKWASNFTLAPLNINGCHGKLLYIQTGGGTQYILNNPPANVNQGGWGILSFAHVGSDTSSLLQWYGNVAEGNVGGVTVHWQDGQW